MHFTMSTLSFERGKCAGGYYSSQWLRHTMDKSALGLSHKHLHTHLHMTNFATPIKHNMHVFRMLANFIQTGLSWPGTVLMEGNCANHYTAISTKHTNDQQLIAHKSTSRSLV